MERQELIEEVKILDGQNNLYEEYLSWFFLIGVIVLELLKLYQVIDWTWFEIFALIWCPTISETILSWFTPKD